MFVNASTSFKGSTAADIVSIPNISIAKPRSMLPIFFLESLFAAIVNTIPISAKTGVKLAGLQS